MATFVFDRTLADVQAMNAKGTYNAADLTRVTMAINEIAADLNAEGYPVTITWLKQNWLVTDIPTVEQMDNYLENVGKIKAALPNTAPAPPASMAFLTYEGANNIERILYEVETLLNNTLSIYPRSGVWTSGGIIFEVTT